MTASRLPRPLAPALLLWGLGAILVPLPALAQAGGGGAETEARAPEERRGAAPLPLVFLRGETLHYSGDFGVFGKVGTGTLAVRDPVCHEGRPAVRLDFSFQGRVMLMTIRDRTLSVVDLEHHHSLRYEKEERHPMGTREERVAIYPQARMWEPEGDVARALHAAHPLDELSFIYLARSVRLAEGEMREFDLHFDPARSPVRLRDRGMERVQVPAGTFETRVVEMEVRDPTRFGEAGRVVLNITDDQARIPVRIASAMPVVGSLVMVLESMERGGSPLRPGTLRCGAGASG
jgi:hypothetical protein